MELKRCSNLVLVGIGFMDLPIFEWSNMDLKGATCDFNAIPTFCVLSPTKYMQLSSWDAQQSGAESCLGMLGERK